GGSRSSGVVATGTPLRYAPAVDSLEVVLSFLEVRGVVGAIGEIRKPIAVDDDAVLALVQRATAVGTLRDRDLEDDGRDRAAATRACGRSLDGWIGGGERPRDLAHLGQSRSQASARQASHRRRLARRRGVGRIPRGT